MYTLFYVPILDFYGSEHMDISPQRILVLKFSSLGDIVHTLPAVSALRQRFPSAHICWLVKSEWASLLEGNPNINEVWPVDLSWPNWPKLIQGIRRRQFDLVVDFQGLFRSGLFGLLSGSPMRVGFAQAREGAGWMYTHHVSLPGEETSPWRLLGIHAVDRNLAIAQFLDGDISRPIFHFPELAEEQISDCDVLESTLAKGHDQVIALAPWSRSTLKSWPLPRFVQLAEKLLQLPKVGVVIMGGPADRQAAEEFSHLESQGLINVVGKLSLRQLPEFLKHMKLVVGNDSSIIHLAAGVGTRVVAIFGPTSPIATGPYPLRQHVVHRSELECSPCGQRTCRNPQHLECLESISVNSLLESIQQSLASSFS